MSPEQRAKRIQNDYLLTDEFGITGKLVSDITRALLAKHAEVGRLREILADMQRACIETAHDMGDDDIEERDDCPVCFVRQSIDAALAQEAGK